MAVDPKKKPDKDEKEIDKILEQTYIQKPEKKKKETRGRKKGSKGKQKLAYTKDKYKDQPLAQIINRVTCGIFNKTLLKNCEKLKENEIELGEAGVYTLEYYADWLDHPLMVLIGASIGLGIVAYDKTQKKIVKSKEHEDEVAYKEQYQEENF